MGLFPTCKELTESLSRGEEPGLIGRLHLWHCELCEKYANQLKLLGEAWRSSAKQPPPQSLLDRLRKNR